VTRRVLEALPRLAERAPALQFIHDSAGLAVSALVIACVAVALSTRAAALREPAAPGADDETLRQLAAAREEEREILCYDLHDGLTQYVLAAQMHLDTFSALRSEEPERAEQELAQARARVREAVKEIHRVIANLNLTVSYETSLSQALQQYVTGLAETQRWACDFDDHLYGRRLDPCAEMMAFRIVQEALTNAAKHSQTERVRISLATEGGCLVVGVRDWGIGFDPASVQQDPPGVGLRSLCARARLLGGTCDINSAPGEGTQVTVRLPCNLGEDQGDSR
jgi:signal transduction histidine kinase